MNHPMMDGLGRHIAQGRRNSLKALALGLAAVGTAPLAASAKKNKAGKKKCKKKTSPTCTPLAIGAPCVNARDCCGTETNLSCGETESGSPSGLVCCGTQGIACESDDDCCGGFLCTSGACTVVI